MKKVKIELTPYESLAILRFLREWINEDTDGDLRYKAIQDATSSYENEVYKKIDMDQLEDAMVENAVNKLTGKWPI